ncbi:MAG: MATE family efflux transporter [Clostridiales bacterium]|nr:MATE family efflux transporter [Clostridiales bacterium]
MLKEKNQVESVESRREFYKNVLRLILPLAVQNLINVGVSAADVIMLGKVGETVLSGASLAGQVPFVLNLLFFGLTSGACVLTAQYWGKQDVPMIEKVLGLTLKIAFCVSAIFSLLGMFIPGYLMRIFTSDQEVIREGVRYLRVVSVSFLFTGITMSYLNIMRSVERVFISTIVYFISLCLNIVFNALFIFGFATIPAMGIVGAALATVLARGVELLLVLFYAFFWNHSVRIRWSCIGAGSHDPVLLKDFIHYSVPVTLNELMWGGGYSANAAIIGHLGQAAVAASSVAQVVRQLAMVIALGIANAAAIMIGKTIGAGEEKKAVLYSKRLIGMSALAGVSGMSLILILIPVITHFLHLTENANEYLVFMLFVMSYYMLAQSFNTTFVVGIFRGGGDTRFGLFIDVSTMWGCSIILGALAAFVWKLPVRAVYVLLMSDELFKIPLCIYRYRSKKWLTNVTRS